MPRIDFHDLPEHSRVWVFPANRALTDQEVQRLLAEVDAFLTGWAAHGHPLRSGRLFIDDHFLLVGVDEDAEAPSGCSIDALVNRLEGLASGLGVHLVDHAPVWFRESGSVRTVTRAEFRALAREGAVTPDTRVFDTSLTRMKALRGEGLERAARESWHGRAFFSDLLAS
jgi:hypothetical protein